MAITPSDFNKIWSTNASTPAYTFSDAEYQQGWDFVGNLPPTRAMWNALQKQTDEKMQYIFANFGAPLVANTVADMTDQNRVYVYTGNETGYTAGHWYYWDGNAWADGGVYNSIAVSTDTTLSIAGKPADAQATGEAIDKTKAEMSLFGVDDLLWDNTNPSSNTQAGVSWTVNNIDKTVTVTGTATGTSVINFYGMSDPYPSWLEKGKQYFLHFDNEDVYAVIQYKNSSNTDVTLFSTHKTQPFVIPADAQAIRIRLTTGSGATGKVYNTVARPFISEAKTLFELDNVDESIVKKLGIVVAEWESGGIYTNNGNKYTDSTKVRSADFVPVVSGEKLIVCTSHDAIAPVIFYNADKSYNSYVGGVTNRTLYIDVPNNAEYMKIQASNSVLPSTQITADFGSNVSVYRVDGDIYRSLVYMGVRYGITEDDFTTIADLPMNSVVRIPRNWLDTDIETLPYYNESEYYIFTFGRVDGINFKTQIALDPTWNCFYIRRFDVNYSVWGDWNLVGKEIQRTYTDNELDANQVILLSTQYVDNLYFNSAQRVVTNANYKSKLIPIKKGTTVFLNTSGAAALPYAKIKHNFLIDEIYDANQYYSGYITFDYDGFLAVNCYNGNYEKFICKVFIDNAETVNSVQFTNALQVPSIIPEYDSNNVCRVLNRGSSMMGAIHSWGIIGASWDCGEMNYTVPGFGQKEIDWEEYSSWTVLKKLNNIPDLYIYASGGQNAKDWISLGANTVRGYAYDSDTEVVNPYWSGRSGIGHFGGCWWKVKDDYEHGIVKQAYYVGLGGNDIANNYPFNADSTGIAEGYDPTRYYECGTIEDIGTYDLATDTDTVPAGKTAGVIPGVVNSYCAYMGALLNRLIAIQPNCIIFLATPRNSFGATQYQLDVWEQYCDAIHQIAQMPQFSNNVYVLPLGESIENNRAREWRRFILGNHPDALGYQYLAYYLNTLIDYVILTNYINMKQSMYIGTDKHWDESDIQ